MNADDALKSEAQARQRAAVRNVALALILLGVCLKAFRPLPTRSATNDEAVHLAAGYSYWQTRDFRMNPEHPPLAKLIAALPVWFLHPKFDTAGNDWKTADQYPFGFRFLYDN